MQIYFCFYCIFLFFSHLVPLIPTLFPLTFVHRYAQKSGKPFLVDYRFIVRTLYWVELSFGKSFG